MPPRMIFKWQHLNRNRSSRQTVSDPDLDLPDTPEWQKAGSQSKKSAVRLGQQAKHRGGPA
jgi:hypothetical protein